MSGEENNPNSMNRVWALGELLPLQGKVLRSTETYIKKRQLSFSSSQKKKPNTVKNYGKRRTPQNTPSSQH